MSEQFDWREAWYSLDREASQLRDAAKTAEAWLERWAAHVGNCPAGGMCSCGLEAARHELRNVLVTPPEAD